MSQGEFYLQFEGVSVVGAGGEVGMDPGPATERSSVRWLFVVTVLGLHTFAVAGRRVGGAHCLTTCTQSNTWTFFKEAFKNDSL